MILQRVHLAKDAERECRSGAIGQRLAAPLTTRFPQASPGELRGTYDHAHHLMGREACLVASRSVKRAGGSVASAAQPLIGRRRSRDGCPSLGLRARSYRTSSLGRPTRLHPHAHTRRQYELVCRETAPVVGTRLLRLAARGLRITRRRPMGDAAFLSLTFLLFSYFLLCLCSCSL